MPDAPSGGVAGLLLAAGGGRRYGGPKALVELGGRLLVERAADVLRAGGCDPVVVVLGASSDVVRARAALGPAVIVDNPDWETGTGSSLRAGLASLATADPVAAVVLPVDVPGVTPEAVRRVAGHAGSDVLAVATFHGRPGHPVLLGRSHWPGIAERAVGDVGARPYLRERDVVEVPCDDIADGRDVDRPQDLPDA